MVRSFQQFFDNINEEPREGSSNIIFGRNNEEKKFELVSDIGNYESGHTFRVSDNEYENTTIIEVGTGMSSVTVLDEYDEPIAFVGSSSKINLLFDEIIPTENDVVRLEDPVLRLCRLYHHLQEFHDDHLYHLNLFAHLLLEFLFGLEFPLFLL